MNPIFQAALEFEAYLTSRNWRFCFIGGLAVQRWGEPRFTADVDLTLMTGFGREGRFFDEILGEFSGRITDAGRFAKRSRVLLVEEGIMGGQQTNLDRALIVRELEPLAELKKAPEILSRLRKSLDTNVREGGERPQA